MRSASLGLAVLCFALVAAPAASNGLLADELQWSGFNETRWRMRATSATDDQDVYDSIFLAGRGQSMAFQLHGSVAHDLEGLSPEGRFERFQGLTDTFGDRTHAYLYSASFDLGGAAGQGKPLLRVGRQWRYQAETLQFDGASLRLAAGRFAELSAIGGVPVHLYETSARGDRLGGAGLRVRPLDFLELGADYTKLTDARDGSTILPRKDELAEASAVLRLADFLVLRGASSWVDGKARKLSVRGSLDLPDAGFSLTASALRQESSLEDLVTELAPAWQVLGVYRPYQSYQLALRQALNKKVALELEGQQRLLNRKSDESAYNHDFQRYRAALLLDELAGGFGLDVYAEAWQSRGAAGDDMNAFGFALERALGGAWKASAGSEFARFKYDLISRQERQDVRTWFLRLERAAPKGWGLRASYEFEDDQETTFQVFDLSIRRSF